MICNHRVKPSTILIFAQYYKASTLFRARYIFRLRRAKKLFFFSPAALELAPYKKAQALAKAPPNYLEGASQL
jgi:hypothetical protein